MVDQPIDLTSRHLFSGPRNEIGEQLRHILFGLIRKPDIVFHLFASTRRSIRA